MIMTAIMLSACSGGSGDSDPDNSKTQTNVEMGDPQDNNPDEKVINSNSDLDQDGDGFSPAAGDCNDNNSNIFPYANEIVNNGIDENCSGSDSITQGLQVTILSPESLQTFGTPTITVRGTVSSATADLLVNREAVPNVDGTFSAEVSLEEGFNTISIIAREFNQEGVDSITATLDLTPPILTIESHANAELVFTEHVTVTGLVNDSVRGTVSEGEASVTLNGTQAAIANRSYSETIPLTLGLNTINITATDAVGNTTQSRLELNRVTASNDTLRVQGGQHQTALVQSTASEPLSVRATNRDGQPLPNLDVVFRVIQGDGTVRVDTNKAGRATLVTTDQNGVASTQFRIGSRSGVSNHKVRASVVGIETEVVFLASAIAKPGANIGINTMGVPT